MAVWNSSLRSVRSTFVILWMLMWNASCDVQLQGEEEEIFHSDIQTKLGWTSEPPRKWKEIKLPVGTDGTTVPVLQACENKIKQTILSPWMECKDAHYLLMDISIAQEEESSGQLNSVQVYCFDSDTPITKFRNSEPVLSIQTSKLLPDGVHHNQMSNFLNRSLALNVCSLSRRGFQIAFSFSGACVFLTSIRLYYRRCPDIVSDLVSFGGMAAGSEPLSGSCVEGAVEVSPPLRECNMNGVWMPLQGGCTCKTGHQVMNDTCEACKMGYYKAANESAGCQLCPRNTGTQKEGSERCDCLQGFSRLPSDPHDLGCTKPPSAPVNLTARHHNDSVLTVTWDPPHDRGGRQEVKYHVKCEKEADAGSQWEACGSDVIFLPYSAELTNTSVKIMGLNPQRDYRLSVQASNDISILQGAPHLSTAAITIHRWKLPPVVITVIPDLNLPILDMTAAPQHQSRFFMWLTVGVLFSILLLMAVIPTVMCVLRKSYTKLRSDNEIELLPLHSEISYRRTQIVESPPQQSDVVEGVTQLLEGLGGRLLDSLREVLVEREQLTLGKELGKGEFGSVYEGVFTPEGGVDIKVAVKTMRVGIHSQEDLHEFLREAEIMKNFDHENVVRLLGVTLQREQDSPLPVPLVILPYMKHGDLRRFLIATRYGDIPMFVPHQSLLRFMIDIAAGMDYLSQQGFLHRDLAARNCMLGDDLRVCVADFGLSKKIYSSNYYRQKVAIRVPIKWMAMESLSESIYTTKSDVWSFGVTMWEIVSRGRTPYPGVHNHELLDLLQSGHRLKPPEDCDHKLYEIMKSCWNREPPRRPGFGELAEALKGLLAELPILEASQEASYINQGLAVAAAAAAAGGASQDSQTDSRGRWENVYLPNPVGATATFRDDDVEVEDGYLKYITGSAVKENVNH
ncbi:tyrosine-protein kinase receptor TYRO3-like [Acanthochromis polyacanthus]|uniref:tyrosine-protein kinase receptor TYRO3-like n=1 Tax=Acanthochromis polyacanthus TaxID=80966 RepID=UPI0022344690|nr:tyrosine-protein kinase receptor TYRO3-like [Acanthochromis polyacanthus]